MHSAAGRGLESLRLLVSDPDLPSPPSAARRHAPPLPRWVLGAWLGSLALALAACASTRVRIKLVPVLVDPATAQNDARWAGAAALVGIMAWTASATALLIAGHALPRRGEATSGPAAHRRRHRAGGARPRRRPAHPRVLGAPTHGCARRRDLPRPGRLGRGARGPSPQGAPLVARRAACDDRRRLRRIALARRDLRRGAPAPRPRAAIEDVLKLWAVGLLALVCVREALAATAPARSVPLSLEDRRVPTLDLTDHARPSAPAPAPEGLADSRR